VNLINILNKEIKHNFREKKGNIMMILFPMALMIILGMALSSFFNNSITHMDIKVLYTNNAGETLTEAFNSFVSYGSEMGISFEETNDAQRGMDSVKETEYSCYIVIEDNPQELKLYKNDRYSFEANLVGMVLDGFTQRYNAISSIASVNPSALAKIMEETRAEFVSVTSLDRSKQPTSKDYYAVAVLTLILMYASQTGFWSIKNEKNLRTQSRMLCAPVNRYEILTAKVLGSIFITIIQALVVIGFSKYILKANWGSNVGVILLVLISEAVMSVSLGTSIAFVIKNEGAALAVLNTIIPILVLLGGGYTPLNIMGNFFIKISIISPVRWINRAIFRVIYADDLSLIPVAILLNLALAAVFIAVSSLLYKKEAA
jgi:ABC-2 type transport system permease protein